MKDAKWLEFDRIHPHQLDHSSRNQTEVMDQGHDLNECAVYPCETDITRLICMEKTSHDLLNNRSFKSLRS